ncbi:MAG: BON domain-containing protein [Desulfobacterales bacterium]|jgi:osmotically-inducible protein OsmY
MMIKNPVKINFVWTITILAVLSLTAAAASRQTNDLDITLAVDTQLENDDGVPAHMIDILTQNGVVTLSGSVPHLLARDRADDIAATVKGVRSIINRLEVLPVIRTDDLIRREVEIALLEDPATDLFDLKVAVEEGFVTLSGMVNSWQEQQLCVKTAKGVMGVKQVGADIKVSQPTRRPDNEVAAEIDRKLDFDIWVRNQRIEVSVLNGHVILKGVVPSLAEKKRAFMDAWVAGVVSVDDNDVQVDPLWFDDRMRRLDKPALKPDGDVRQALEDVFSYDPRISGSDLEIMVTNGIVTLKGRVENLAARLAAEQDAENTAGVWQVKNHLKVRPELIGPQTRPMPDTDADLARDVRAVLARHPHVHQHEIGVTVNNRLVILRGSVDSAFEKKMAAEAVSRLRGVAGVVNNLRLNRDWKPKDDWEIGQDIKAELWWSPFVDEDSISVSVSDGIATLTGVVDTLRDRRTATKSAYEGGARQVRNHLKVRNGPAELRP